jgi:prepilin signal peptidase PulO-like enzyme (type II secretory pathway)
LPPIVLFSEFRGDFILNLLHPFYASLLGICVGSFLNVCLLRWKSGEPVFFPASHCPSCRHFLSWYENVPVISFFALNGKCRYCKALISWQYPVIELSTSLLFLFSSLRFSNEPIMILSSYFFVVFLILLVASDIKWRLFRICLIIYWWLPLFFFIFQIVVSEWNGFSRSFSSGSRLRLCRGFFYADQPIPQGDRRGRYRDGGGFGSVVGFGACLDHDFIRLLYRRPCFTADAFDGAA